MTRRCGRRVLIALALAVTACADDDTTTTDTAASATAATAPAAPAATGTTAPAGTPAASTAAATSAPPTATGSAATTATSTSTTSAAATTTSTATSPPSTSAAPAADPTVTLTPIAELAAPVDLAWRAGDPHLYVAEQDGRVMRIDPAGGEPTEVLDMTDRTDADGERGLLGLAFSPDGTLAYVNYTDLDGNTTIQEHPVADDGAFASGDESRTVLFIEQPYANHNGGDLTFGPDGFLYIGTGDGGAGGDPERRATDLSSLLGKMLRIDPAIGAGQPYTAPADNPFVETPDAAPEIWALGLRNPWRFSFDAETGDLWIADVGQGDIEEIDVVAATEGVGAGRGANFGWSAFEGNEPFNDDVEVTDPVAPILTYTHDEGCSVSGGVRARGAGAGSLVGWYVFGDYCANTLWALEVLDGGDGQLSAGRRVTLTTDIAQPSAIVAGPDGEVYALSLGGPVYRLDA